MQQDKWMMVAENRLEWDNQVRRCVERIQEEVESRGGEKCPYATREEGRRSKFRLMIRYQNLCPVLR